MSDEKDKMYEQLKKLLSENKLNIPSNQHLVMPETWRDKMENSRYFGMDFASDEQTDDPLGIKVTYSPYIEQGTAYIMDIPKFTLPERMEYIRRFEEEIQQRIFQSFGIPRRYFEQEQPERPYRWQKQSSENLLQWGERLGAQGLLDNPDIRWAYQWAILCWLVQYPLKLFKISAE